MMRKLSRWACLELAVAGALLSVATAVKAFDAAGVQAEVLEGRPYSPYADRAFPSGSTRVYPPARLSE